MLWLQIYGCWTAASVPYFRLSGDVSGYSGRTDNRTFESCSWPMIGKALITQKYAIRYSLYAIAYWSPPQTRFRSFHATSLECRLWRRHRIRYLILWAETKSYYRIIANTLQHILCDQGLTVKLFDFICCEWLRDLLFLHPSSSNL